MPSPATEVSTFVWVWDKPGLRNLLQYAIPTSDVITFDLETTGLDEHAVTGGQANGGVGARIVLASFTLDHDDRETTYLVPLSHPQSPLLGQWRKVTRLLAQAMRGHRLVGHNVKFDLRWLHAVTGVDLSPWLHWDTMLSAHLVDENSSHKLKEVAPAVFGIERWDDFSLNKPGAAEEVDLFQLGEYAGLDTLWTYRLYRHDVEHLVNQWSDIPPALPDEVEVARLGQLMEYVTIPTARTLTAIEQRGLILDTEWVQEERHKLQNRREAAFNELATLYIGDDLRGADGAILDASAANFAPTSLWFQAWATAAVRAGDLKVASLTPSGKPQWSKSVLNRQARAGSHVAQLLLDYRDASKKVEFLDSWLDKVSPDGRIHATYNVGSVSTGRLSSSGPNMQQVTRTLRPAFQPSPGYYLAELDYSQIELRVAAFISRCEPMIEAFNRGDDLHTLLAARIADKPLEEVTKEERQRGKSANFGLIYGMGAAGFREYSEDAYGVVMSEEEAAEVHATYFATWKGLREWHSTAGARLMREQQAVSPIGRIRRLSHLMWDEFRAQRAAINSPVQGMASDIMQIAASLIEGTHPLGETPVDGARLVGTVHDSILVEVRTDDWESVVGRCKKVMEDDVLEILRRLGCDFDVPLVADATVGRAWGLDDVSGG